MKSKWTPKLLYYVLMLIFLFITSSFSVAGNLLAVCSGVIALLFAMFYVIEDIKEELKKYLKK